MSVVSVDISANSFYGISGKQYIVYPSLSTERYQVLETLQIELEYATSMSGFKAELEKAYRALNEVKFADAAIIINNILNGAARIESGQPNPVLMICTLFICTPDENQARWSESEAAEKIKDWAAVDVAFFLTLVRRLYRRFMPDLNFDSPNTSQPSEADGKETTSQT